MNMTSKIKPILIISLLCFSFSNLFSSALLIQGGSTMKIYGKVLQPNSKPLENAEIQILHNNKPTKEGQTSKNGKFSFSISLNTEYVFVVKCEGYIQKSVELYTSVPDKFIKNDHEYEFDVKLMKYSDKLDIEVMLKPVGLVFFNDEKKYWDYNKEYTIAYKKEIDKQKPVKDIDVPAKKLDPNTSTEEIKTKQPEKQQPVKTEKIVKPKKEDKVQVVSEPVIKQKETDTKKTEPSQASEIAKLKKEEEEQKMKEREGKITKDQQTAEMLMEAKDAELVKQKEQVKAKEISYTETQKNELAKIYLDSIQKETVSKHDVVVMYKEEEKKKEEVRQKKNVKNVQVEKTLNEVAVEERKKNEENLAKSKAKNPLLYEGGLILSNKPQIKEEVIEEFLSTTFKTILIYPTKNDVYTKVEKSIWGKNTYFKNNHIITEQEYNNIMEIVKIIKNNK